PILTAGVWSDNYRCRVFRRRPGRGAVNRFPGGHRGRVTPVPIPNTEVKPATADGTASAGVWESRSLPGIYSEGLALMSAGPFRCTASFGTLPELRYDSPEVCMRKPCRRQFLKDALALAALPAALPPRTPTQTVTRTPPAVAIVRCRTYEDAEVRSALSDCFDRLGGLDRLVRSRTV